MRICAPVNPIGIFIYISSEIHTLARREIKKERKTSDERGRPACKACALQLKRKYMTRIYIDKATAQKITETARIKDVVGDYVKLQRKGESWTGLCPFHNDRHVGNFFVNPKKNIYRCFACNAGGDSIEFIERMEGVDYHGALLRLANKYCIEIPEAKEEQQKIAEEVKAAPITEPKQDEVEEPPMLVLPMDYVTARMDTHEDTLCNWLRGLNWNAKQRERLEHTLSLYGVGHARQGHTIFWQIDEQYRVRTAKMMLYKSDGHRDREHKGNFHWIHNLLAQAGKVDLDKTEYKTTLFGMHLLNQNPERICIVESEKTALLAAIYFGSTDRAVWMASGGLSMLTPYRLAPILESGKEITLYPDKDGVDRWRQQTRKFDNGHVSCSTFYLDTYWEESDGPKADLGDILVKIIGKNKEHDNVEATKGEDKFPLIKEDLERFANECAPTHEQKKTEGKQAATTLLAEMSKKNPSIALLVERLDLTPVAIN